MFRSVSLAPADASFGAQTTQHRGQKGPRWNMGWCIFSARPPHVRHGLVTFADWMHRSIDSRIGPAVKPILPLDPRPPLLAASGLRRRLLVSFLSRGFRRHQAFDVLRLFI
jgi:hypothetical protein